MKTSTLSVIQLMFSILLSFISQKALAQIRAEQLETKIYDGSIMYCADAGASDTYTCNLNPAPASYVTGANYAFKANTANTGAATINFNSLGAKAIKKWSSAAKADIATGDIGIGQVVVLRYDGTDMVAVSLGGGAGGGGISGLTTGCIPKAASSTSIADSSACEDADSYNIAKNVEIGNVGTNSLTITTSAITGAKTYTAARNTDGDIALTTGTLTNGNYPAFDSSGRLISTTHGKVSTRVYNSGSISINSGTDTFLTFDSERWDTDTMHSTSSNQSRVTINTAGKYIFICQVAWGANDIGVRKVALVLNNTTLIGEQRQAPTAASYTSRMAVSTIYDFAATDYVECQVYQDSGSNLNATSVPNQSPEFIAFKLD